MELHEQAKNFPTLPEETYGIANGKYTVPCFEQAIAEAKNDQTVYHVWFKTPPLGPDVIERFHRVMLIAESHDQGFCDNPNEGNWTWFELSIMENDQAVQPRVKDGIELTWISHKNRLGKKNFKWAQGNKFKEDHDMFRLLEDGNVISIRLCARFPEWKMYAKSAYLIIELTDPNPRKPLEYGKIVQNVQFVQKAFQAVNKALPEDSLKIPGLPEDHIFQAEKINTADNHSLRVLSLDGGGVHGLSALHLLKAVMDKAAPGRKPCEVFDMIGGTSTGGLIAIMLGRLRMSVDDCLRKYEDVMKDVFPDKSWLWKGVDFVRKGAMWDASGLENSIKAAIRETLKIEDPESVQLQDDESEKSSCKVFVMAVNKIGPNNHQPVLLRSYTNTESKNEIPNIKIWEAARATSAAPAFFEPLKVGNYTFLDGGLQANNPLGWLWNEVLRVYGPARNTACFLSIGTGVSLSETVSDVRNVFGITGDLVNIATNTENPNLLFRDLINNYAPRPMTKKYWRFDVGDGLPDWVEEDGVWKWKLLAERQEKNRGKLDDTAAKAMIEKDAEEYLKLPAAKKLIGECAVHLHV